MIEHQIVDYIVPTGIASGLSLIGGALWRARRCIYLRFVYDGKVRLTFRFDGGKPRRAGDS